MEVSITDSQSLDRLSLHSQEDLDDINIEKYLQSAGRAAGWAKDFDCLLSDSIGLGKFTEFLQKEFSHENIFFWSACEKFKLLGAGADRLQLAQEILRRHLELGAAEPVNVDSAARAATRHRVALATAAAPPEASVFMSAQRQIYNLMKFDSYPRCGPRPGVPRAVTHRLATPRGMFTTSPRRSCARSNRVFLLRFLKSAVYKECIRAEMSAVAASELGLVPGPGDTADTADTAAAHRSAAEII